MSYRFLWKQIVSKALGSAMARGLLALNSDELWARVGRAETFSPEQLEKLRADIEARLNEVAEQGAQERELVSKVIDEMIASALRRKGGL